MSNIPYPGDSNISEGPLSDNISIFNDPSRDVGKLSSTNAQIKEESDKLQKEISELLHSKNTSLSKYEERQKKIDDSIYNSLSSNKKMPSLCKYMVIHTDFLLERNKLLERYKQHQIEYMEKERAYMEESIQHYTDYLNRLKVNLI